jgi:tubulin-specific chaperone A
VFGPLRDRIETAVGKLEDLVASEEKNETATPEELANAKAALEKGKAKAESS